MVAMAMVVAMEVDGIGPMVVVAIILLVVVGEHQCLQKTDDDNGDDMTWQCDVTPYSERAVQLYSNIMGNRDECQFIVLAGSHMHITPVYTVPRVRLWVFPLPAPFAFCGSTALRLILPSTSPPPP